LTNKWIRGKPGYKILLYPDISTFLKNSPLAEKERLIKEPLNNYYMFTDIMAGCGIGQNGILNLNYEIADIRKHCKSGAGQGTLINSNEKNEYENHEIINNHQLSTY
jgi:hypothetical protein